MAQPKHDENNPDITDDDFVHIETPISRIHYLINLIKSHAPDLIPAAENVQRELDDSSLQNYVGSELYQLKNANKELKDQIEKLKTEKRQTEEKCQDEVYILQQQINEQMKEIYELKSTGLDKNETNGKPYKQHDIDHDVQQKVEDLIDTLELQLRQTENKLQETEADLDEIKTRLSKAMADKLTDNNPNIADLSDRNRPTKIAEKFQELYDNQWTDAFEVVELNLRVNDNSDTEKRSTSILIKILMETKKFCDNEANDQTRAMQNVISARKDQKDSEVNIPTGVNKHIKDCRRNVATFTGHRLYQKYQEELSRSDSTTALAAKAVTYFVKECFDICWLMTVQDPPLAFGPNVRKGERFDSDMYKAYTKNGHKIDFVVWPALLLHTNGPVLAKGIAQGLVDGRQ